jgi:hypothetical protein
MSGRSRARPWFRAADEYERRCDAFAIEQDARRVRHQVDEQLDEVARKLDVSVRDLRRMNAPVDPDHEFFLPLVVDLPAAVRAEYVAFLDLCDRIVAAQLLGAK